MASVSPKIILRVSKRAFPNSPCVTINTPIISLPRRVSQDSRLHHHEPDDGPAQFFTVMAHEILLVQKIRPDQLGPQLFDLRVVHHDRLLAESRVTGQKTGG